MGRANRIWVLIVLGSLTSGGCQQRNTPVIGEEGLRVDEKPDLLRMARDHAVRSVLHSDGPLIPFALIDTADGKRSLARFTTGRNPAEAAEHARAHAKSVVDCVRYAVAADGTITENGERIPAILIEVGGRGVDSVRYIQRFASSSEHRFAQPTGELSPLP